MHLAQEGFGGRLLNAINRQVPKKVLVSRVAADCSVPQSLRQYSRANEMPANEHYSQNRMRYEEDGVRQTLKAAVAVVKDAREVWGSP